MNEIINYNLFLYHPSFFKSVFSQLELVPIVLSSLSKLLEILFHSKSFQYSFFNAMKPLITQRVTLFITDQSYWITGFQCSLLVASGARTWGTALSSDSQGSLTAPQIWGKILGSLCHHMAWRAFHTLKHDHPVAASCSLQEQKNTCQNGDSVVGRWKDTILMFYETHKLQKVT